MPKKTDLAKVTESQIKYIENQLNSRPRKCLNFATPYDVLQTASVALHSWMWGDYKGAFKEIIARQFVPLVNVEIEEIFEKDDQVCKKKQNKKPFIASNKDYSESIDVID